MSIELDSLEIQVKSSAGQAVSGIDALGASLERLKKITKGGVGLTTVKNQLEKVNSALSGLKIDAGKIGALANGLNQLSQVQKASGLSSVANALSKITKITESLDEQQLSSFAAQMQRVADAVRPLATEMQKVASGFAAFPIRIQKIISANSGLATSNMRSAKSFNILGTGITSLQAKFGIYYALFQRVASIMGGWVRESNNYVENLNLFNVAMGEAASTAYDYAYAVKDALGIDPSEWMRNQGVFKQITAGFGVVEEKANLMSKNLTQIGYDISSFFNISIEEAMQKVQSGISGELEPLRRLGYALDQATLQEIAYEHGIKQKITTMNQAQKSQLRYLAIMQQSENVMGDMARTIQTPANAMRILNQQMTQLARALGNLLIPFLQKVIPWVQAFVEVLTEAIQALAVLVGFELPTIDYSSLGGISGSAEEAEDSIGGATSAAKELRRALLGIDELTILEPTNTGSSGGGASVGSGDLGLDLPEYDFLAGLTEQTDELKEKLKPLLDIILRIASTLAALKIASKFMKSLRDVVDNLKKGGQELDGWTRASKIINGAIILTAGLAWSWQSGYNIGRGVADFKDYLGSILGPIAAGVGGALIGSVIPGLGTGVGFAIGLTLGLIFEVVAAFKGTGQKLIDQFYASEPGKELAALHERVAASAENLTQLQVDLSNLTAFLDKGTFIDDETLAKLTLAQELIHDIFVIDSQENLSSAELSLIEEKVGILNGLNLPGLKIDLDPNGRLVQTQEELDGVIEKLFEYYRVQALQDALIEAYRIETEGYLELLNLNQEYDLAEVALSEANSALAESESKLAEARAELKTISDEGYKISLGFYDTWPQELKREYDETAEKIVELNDEIERQKVRVSETSKKFDFIKQKLQESLPFYEEARKAVGNVEAAYSGLHSTLEKESGEMIEMGSSIPRGLAEGIEKNRSEPIEALEGLVALDSDSLITLTRERLNSNSPSKVFEDFGLGVDQGLANGIKKNMGLVTDGMDSMLNALLSRMETFTNRCRDALNSMVRDFANVMKSVNVSSAGIVSYSTVSKKTIPKFAAGGFPEQGQLFLAREAGAELVGAIGNRTAVANNQQIVQGISTGVSEANSELINIILAAAQQVVNAVERGGDIYMDGDKVGEKVTEYQNRQNRIYGKTLQLI